MWLSREESFRQARRNESLGAFMRPVSIHTGAWRYPGAYPDANFNFAQRRGLFRTGYEGATLRDNLGLPRPPNRFFAS